MPNAETKPITLVPHSGVQFLTFGFDIEAGPKFSRRFLERPQFGKQRPDGTTPLLLLPAYNEIDPEGEPPFVTEVGDDEYDINKLRALEPFIDRWVPAPILAVRPGASTDGLPILAQGPSNWARLRISPTNRDDTGFTHVAVFAFDTQLLPRDNLDEYFGPSEEDARNEQEFTLAHRFRDLGWFFSSDVTDPQTGQVSNIQQWTVDWIKGVFLDMKKRQTRGRVFREEDLDHKLEHLARYIALLNFLAATMGMDRVKLIDTVSEEPFAKPVQVDLILDVGNSRTCGVLIESFATDSSVEPSNSMVLELRDLTRPEIVYRDPFDSHVVLAQADFGPERLSKTSGRVKAFFWPSMVRIGPEASRYQEDAEGGEEASGMSSPKRYLWDTGPVLQPWRYQRKDYDELNLGPMIDRASRLLINGRGDVLTEVKAERALYESLVRRSDLGSLTDFGLRLTASRSSFFTFMVAEIIAQALSMINNYQVRQNRKLTNSPRRLNRLILTMPTAMPVREQRIMRSRVNGAVSLVWDLMGWGDVQRSTILRRPETIVRWDEASCVQFVYLYTEIVKKLGRDVPAFFNLAGRKRPFAEADARPQAGAENVPSIRVASVDIGGGTTDLMVTTYYADGKYAIRPVQSFRESFRIAGDDVLRAVIERAVLPQIEAELRNCGMHEPHEFLVAKFGGNRANMSEPDKHLRQQFVSRILRPIGLDLLQAFEVADLTRQETKLTKTIATLVAEKGIPVASPRIEGYVSEDATAASQKAFDIRAVEIVYDYARVKDAVISVLDSIFSNAAEALNHFDCDVVLLSGRPSRLPATVDLLVNKLAVAPDRVMPLHEYRIGAWYPFKTKDNVRISDPKTATVVGGLLCALAERNIMNLTIDTTRLSMKSTARFIGQLENDGTLPDENVLFVGNGANLKEAEKEVRYDTLMRIGFRQLPFKRWTANPLYKLSLPAGARAQSPVTVTLRRGAPDDDVAFEEINKFQKAEAQKEEIQIAGAWDANGASLAKLMQLSFDTMGADEGYWLDTGILAIE